MASVFAALVSGLLFGLGLTVSQMINPAKVIAFIDVFGDFDPSLVLVMATAIPVTALGYALAARCRSPVCAPGFVSPTRTQIGSSVSVDVDDRNGNCRVDVKTVRDDGSSLVNRGVNACHAEGHAVLIR